MREPPLVHKGGKSAKGSSLESSDEADYRPAVIIRQISTDIYSTVDLRVCQQHVAAMCDKVCVAKKASVTKKAKNGGATGIELKNRVYIF